MTTRAEGTDRQAGSAVVVAAEPLLVGCQDAARLVGIPYRSFQRALANGRVPPATTRIGRRRLWAVEELREWVRAGCHSSSAAEAVP